MKGKKLKTIAIILIVILISMVAFLGVYVQVQNRMENQIKKYQYAMDLDGERYVQLKLNTENKTVIKDQEGNLVSNSDSLTDEEITEKNYVKEEVPYNNQETLNLENYNASKKVIEERLKSFGCQEYNIRLNEETGDIVIELDENTNTDDIVGAITTVGKFEIQDAETGEVLMDNNDIKDVQVLYGSSSQSSLSSTGTSVYLSIEFNDDGTKKLENITSTYTNTTSSDDTTNSTENTETSETEETTETTEKKINMLIDDETIMSTSFDSVIRTGKLQLTYGSSSTDTETIKDYGNKASKIANTLKIKMPLKYDVNENKYILSDITHENLQKAEIVVGIVIVLALIIFIFRYKLNGLLGAISYIGLIATLLLVIRYANVVVSLEGIFAVILVAILNYIFVDKILNMIKNKREDENAREKIKESYKNFFLRMIPILIMSIAFCFVTWVQINSFGMIMFWGITVIAIYNFVITATLLKLKNDSNEITKPKKAINVKK